MKSNLRVVLFALARYVNDDRRELVCWPSLTTLASNTGLNKRNVQNNIAELINIGLVTLIERGNGRRSSKYRLNLKLVDSESETVDLGVVNHHPSNHKNTSSGDDESSPQCGRNIIEGVVNHHSGVGESTTKSIIEPVIEKVIEANSAKRIPEDQSDLPVIQEQKSVLSTTMAEDAFKTYKGKKLTGKMLESFLAFWNAFDYKKGKANAADAWMNVGWDKKDSGANNSLFQTILAGASLEATQRPARVQAGGTPIYAQGWLTGRRWEDEAPDLPAAHQLQKSGADGCSFLSAESLITDTDW